MLDLTNEVDDERQARLRAEQSGQTQFNNLITEVMVTSTRTVCIENMLRMVPGTTVLDGNDQPTLHQTPFPQNMLGNIQAAPPPGATPLIPPPAQPRLPTPFRAPPPPPAAPMASIPIATPIPGSRLKFAKPPTFDGKDRDKLEEFELKCTMYLDSTVPGASDAIKINFAVGYLEGDA